MPAPSQPGQFSTPNAHKFRLPKRADETAVAPTPTPARPTPRFAPSWRRHSFLPSHAQDQDQSRAADIHTPGPVSQRARPFRSVDRLRHHTLHDVPRRKPEDAIEDGSSPPRAYHADDATTTEAAETADESPLVGRDAPTVARALTEYPRHAQRRRRHVHDEIEDVAGSDDVDGSGEMVPDSFELGSVLATATPNRQEHAEELPPQRSATLLLSSVQPFKRRRLFVPPGMITSSPKYEDEGEGGDAGSSPPRQRQSKRRPWDVDIDDDDDDSDADDVNNSAMDDEEMRDIFNYGELLEYGDSGDDHGDDDDDDNDNDDDDDYSMFDRTPTRIRRARLAELQESGLAQQAPRPAQPAFPRTRLFMSARRMMDSADGPGEAACAPSQGHDYAVPADFFSPKKRKKSRRRNGAVDLDVQNSAEQYVPGGMAAELRDWLVQIKNGSGLAAAKARSTRVLGEYAVGAVAGPAVGMRLAVGQPTGAEEGAEARKVHLLLAGEDRPVGGGRSEPAAEPATIAVGEPAWEVCLDGQTWVVASNWSRHNR